MADKDVERDERLAAILEEAASELRSRGSIDLAAWQARYPEYLADLSVLLPTLGAFESVVSACQAAGDTHAGPDAPPETGEWRPPAEPPLPQRIGRYEVLGRLGKGGMGTVWKARDTHLQRDVAVKVPDFHGSTTNQANARTRFLREARAAAAIRHPHVCPVYDVGEADGVPYVVMAHVEGQSLADRLAEGPVAVSQAVAVARQVAEALQAVHDHGIVHRDLKPGNVLLDARGQALLTDFGLARFDTGAENLTGDGTLLGTPAYMAPEQASLGSSEVGPRADVYSLGILLYEMLTGQPPFRGDPLTVIYRVAQEVVPPPSSIRADLDPALEKILLGAIARRPEDRYASAGVFAAALAGWADESTKTLVAPAAPAEKPARPVPTAAPRSRKRVLTIVGLAILVLAGAVAVAVLRTPRGTVELTIPAGNVQWFVDDKEQYGWRPGQSISLKLPAGKHRLVAKSGSEEVFGVDFLVKEGEELGMRLTLPPPLPGDDPLRGLFHDKIPDRERLASLPPEVVAVLGSHAWHHVYHNKLADPPYPSFAAFAADGKTVIASRAFRDEVHVWDAATGQPRIPPIRQEHLASVHYSPDGTTVAIVCGEGRTTCKVWDLEKRSERCTLVGRVPFTRVAISPGGKWLATTSSQDRSVTLWDGSTGKEVPEFDSGKFGPNPFAGPFLAFSGDGRRLAAGGFEDKSKEAAFVARVWDVAEMKEICKVSKRLAAAHPQAANAHFPDGEVDALALSTDGGTLAAGGSGPTAGRTAGVVHLWAVPSGEEGPVIVPQKGSIRLFTISPDCKTLAVVADRLREFDFATRVGQFDVATGKELKTLDGGPIDHVGFSPDGKQLVIVEQARLAEPANAIRVWDLETVKQVNEVPEPTALLALAPDGRTLAVQRRQPNVLELWDAARGAPTGTPSLRVPPDRDSVFLAASFNPKGKTIACTFLRRHPVLFDLDSGFEKSFPSLEHGARMVFSPDGKTAANSVWEDRNGTVELWDTTPAKLRVSLAGAIKDSPDIVWAFSPDGAKLVSWAAGRLRLWETATGKEEPAPKAEKQVVAAAISRDGRKLAAVDETGTPMVWEIGSGRDVAAYRNVGTPGGRFTWVAFGPEDRTLITASWDGRIAIHQAPDAEPRVVTLPWPINSFVLSPNCRHAFTSNANGTVYVLRLPLPAKAAP
jgi:WD40 repeat protein